MQIAVHAIRRAHMYPSGGGCLHRGRALPCGHIHRAAALIHGGKERQRPRGRALQQSAFRPFHGMDSVKRIVGFPQQAAVTKR